MAINIATSNLLLSLGVVIPEGIPAEGNVTEIRDTNVQYLRCIDRLAGMIKENN